MATIVGLWLASALVTIWLLFLEAGEREFAVRMGIFEADSVLIGVLLFVALSFLFRTENLFAVLAFTLFSVLVLPTIVAVLVLSPSLGLAGSIDCIPSTKLLTPSHLIELLATNVIAAIVMFYVERQIVARP